MTFGSDRSGSGPGEEPGLPGSGKDGSGKDAMQAPASKDPKSTGQGRGRGKGSQAGQKPSGKKGYPGPSVEREWWHDPPGRIPVKRLLVAGVVTLALLGGLIGGLAAVVGGGARHLRQPAAGQPQNNPPPPGHQQAAPPSPAPPGPAPPGPGPAPPGQGLPAGPPPAGLHLLGQISGSGSRGPGSAFTVPPSGALTARYGYLCPRGPAEFRAELMNADGTDTQVVATAHGRASGGQVMLHPRFGGTQYHVSVTSSCQYRVQVFGP